MFNEIARAIIRVNCFFIMWFKVLFKIQVNVSKITNSVVIFVLRGQRAYIINLMSYAC